MANEAHGTTNVFRELGFPEPEMHQLKADVVTDLADLASHLGLSTADAAARLGLTEAEYLALTRGRFRERTLEELIGFITKLGGTVHVTVAHPAVAS